MLTKGILIFAFGHPQYGRYAYNLAVTIKAVQANARIVIAHDETAVSHLDEYQRSIFDQFIPAPTLVPGCTVKLSAYDLTPFDQTLVLDADMIWLPKKTPDDLFREVEGTDFLAICEGNTDAPSGAYFFWADVEEIRKKYNVTRIHQWRTEVMYFEKTDRVSDMFADAKKINHKSNLDTIKEFAGGIPDELSINISTAIHGIEPKIFNWQPSFWPKMHGERIPEANTLYNNHFLLSVGGNLQTENVKAFYNRIMLAQAPKIGHTHAFPLMSKHQFLPERRKS